MKKILFYNDAKHLGGHELQVLNAIKTLKIKFDIFFIVYEKNIKFIDLLNELDVKIIKIPYSSNRYQILRTLFSVHHIYKLSQFIKNIKPDLVLNIQGNIELGSTMLITTSILRQKNITYIPICHFLDDVTNNGWIAKAKDIINNLYYKLPDAFITLNDFNKSLIQKRCAFNKIHTVLNGIDFDKYQIYDNRYAKNRLSFNDKKKYIALIGRIQFWHKGHDILLNMVEKYLDKLNGYKFVIVGTGENESQMKEIVKKKRLQEYFIFLGHQKDLSLVYSAMDGVVIPSRFESGLGTPMVLLESIYFNLPIVMTNLPEMNLYLKDEYLFEKENIDDFFEKLSTMSLSHTDSSKSRVIKAHSISSFQNNFLKVIEENDI